MAEKAPKLVKARWVASYEAQLPNGTVLAPGETVVEIGEHEALASSNWEVPETTADLKKAAKKLGANVPAGSSKLEVEAIVADGMIAVAAEEVTAPVDEPQPAEPGGDEDSEGSGD
jgi:hypothetical protein